VILELPFSNDPAQVFTIQLGDAKFVFDSKYNDRSGVWTLDLYDAATKALIVASLPLVIGQDLLEPYNFDMGSILCVDTTGQGMDAGPDELGDRVKVYWFSADEVTA
jgi:hypothetical protein